MSRLLKIGLIGMGVTLILCLVIAFLSGTSMALLAPFLMPWSVLILIGLSNRKK